MERILALDISSRSTGWATFEDGKLTDQGLIKIDPKNGWGFRLSVFGQELKRLLDEKQPTTVVIEDIYKGPSPLTFKVLAFFHGVAYQCVSDSLYKEPEVIGVLKARSEIGKEAGVKCSQKEQAFFIINSTLKMKLDFDKDNDIVDACALAYGYFFLNGKKPYKALRFNKKEYEKIPSTKAKKRKKDGPVQSTRNKKGRKQRRSKKSVSKAGAKVSP